MTDKVMDVINNKDDKYKKCLDEIEGILNYCKERPCYACDYRKDCVYDGGLAYFLTSKIRGVNES